MSRKRECILFCLFIMITMLIFSVTVQGMSLDHESPFIPLEMNVLDNGMRVIVREIPEYPTVAVNIWVGAGGRHDPEGKSGLAHFFEHMLFQGTETRTGIDISREIEAAGGSLNALTGLEYTAYYIMVPSNNFDRAIKIQADMVKNSNYPQQNLDYERGVIEQEIRDRNSSPQTALRDAARQKLFASTPYERPVLGSVEDVNDITREDMFAFHEKYYVPNNMTLVVVGDVEADYVFEKAEKYYGEMEGKRTPQQSSVLIPELEEKQEIELERDVEHSSLLIAFPGPGIGEPETVALEMGGIILGSGRSSRLYQILREEKELVTSVSAGYSDYSEIGQFWIMARMPEKNMDEVEKIIRDEIEKLQEEKVTEEELERARAMVRSSFSFQAESNINLALTLGIMKTQATVQDAINIINVMETVTADDIQNAVQRYLDPEIYLRGRLDPKGGNN